MQYERVLSSFIPVDFLRLTALVPVLRHEEALQMLEMDHSYTWFFRTDHLIGILPRLCKATQVWRGQVKALSP